MLIMSITRNVLKEPLLALARESWTRHEDNKKNQEGKKEKLNKSYRCTFKKSAGVLVT